MQASVLVPSQVHFDELTLTERPSGNQRVTWSPAVPGTVEVYVSRTTESERFETNHCVFPGNEGAAELPAELLSKLDWSSAYHVSGRGAGYAIASSDAALLVFHAVYQ
ncbi:MAG: hypothetical protein ACOY0T_10465 [Myxococcota bacterium]